VYIVIMLLVPVLGAAWIGFGMKAFWALTAAAVAVDVVYFTAGIRWLGFTNYLFVWSAIFLLGYAWLDGRFSDRRMLLIYAGLAFVTLLLLVHLAPYPVSMIGVPEDPISNTTPPKAILIALAVMQCGLLLAVEAPARRWLASRTAWTATVAINATIMTIFIWHLTATTLVVFAAYLANGIGLRLEPGSAAWWWARLPWVMANAIALALLVAAFDASSDRTRLKRPQRPPGATWPARS